jgi:hypothetical protein
MTPIISSLFFPVDPNDPATQINAVLATTAVFGVGFFMRPVGGVVLGGRRLMIAPGCVVPIATPDAHYRAVIDAAHEVAGT